MYRVTRDYLPEPPLYIIRDREIFKWVRKFNPCDLYSKSDSRPDLKELKTYYEELVAEFFPPEINW